MHSSALAEALFSSSGCVCRFADLGMFCNWIIANEQSIIAEHRMMIATP
jgi:hypothetical protein